MKDVPKPQIDMPEQLARGYADSLSVADMAWYEFYTDSTLCRIIRRTLQNNRDLQIAASRVEQLRQLYGVQKLNYLPDISAKVGATRETNDYHNESFSRDDEVSLKGSLNWEVDLWGGLSASRRQSGAEYMASVYDRRAMEMTLISEAAVAYFNLVALNNELAIVQRTLHTREQALEKSRLRFEGGLTSELVYQQAKVEVATTAALIPGIRMRIQMATNAITLIMGELPEAGLPTGGADDVPMMEFLPRRLPVGVPSQLLERRPDVRASEQRLKSALAGAGVAYSNQFPKLVIGFTGGWENDEFANLLKSPFSYMLGNITGTLFDFGKKRRKYKAAVEVANQARLGYEKAVLAAFTEVNNAIVGYAEMQATAGRRAELCEAANKYVDLANKQYLGGTISYLDVLDAHRRYFDAQISLSNAVRDEYLAMVALYKALGGGWCGDSCE